MGKKKEREEGRINQRGKNWPVMWLPLRPQPILGALEWGWSFKVAPNWGSGAKPLYSRINQSPDAGWLRVGRTCLLLGSSSAEGNSWGGTQLWVLSRHHHWELGRGALELQRYPVAHHSIHDDCCLKGTSCTTQMSDLFSFWYPGKNCLFWPKDL